MADDEATRPKATAAALKVTMNKQTRAALRKTLEDKKRNYDGKRSNMADRSERILQLDKQKKEAEGNETVGIDSQIKKENEEMEKEAEDITKEAEEIKRLEKDLDGDTNMLPPDNDGKDQNDDQNVKHSSKKEDDEGGNHLKDMKQHIDPAEDTEEIVDFEAVFSDTSGRGTVATRVSEWKGSLAFRRTRGSQDKDTVDMIRLGEKCIWRFTNRSLTDEQKERVADLSDPNKPSSMRRIERATKEDLRRLGRPDRLLGVFYEHNFSKEDQLIPLNPADPRDKWKYEHIELVNPFEYATKGRKYYKKKMPVTYAFFKWPTGELGVETRSALKKIWPRKGLTPINDLIYQTLCDQEPGILQDELDKPEFEHVRQRIETQKTLGKQESTSEATLIAPQKTLETQESASQTAPVATPAEQSHAPAQAALAPSVGEDAAPGPIPPPSSETPAPSVEGQAPVGDTLSPGKSLTPTELLENPDFKDYMRSFARRRKQTPETMTKMQKTNALAQWEDAYNFDG